MSSGRSGRPEKLRGNKDPNTEDAREGSQWERYSGSEASVEGEGEEDEDVQEFLPIKWGQEAPEIRYGQLDQILESISALALSVTILQFQADREQQLPQQGTRSAVLLRRAPKQARLAVQTVIRRQGTPTFPPAPSHTLGNPSFPPTPTQAH